jgi:alpha-galactosidase
MADVGYKYIIVDDGWWAGRAADGGLRIRTNIIPSAITNSGQTSFSPFVNKLHALGFKVRIYTDIGRNACSQIWDANSPNLPVGSMSAREVGSFGHQKDDARLFLSKWHFDFIKVDACGIADYGPDSSLVKTGLFRPFEPLIIRGDPLASNVKSVEQLYYEFNRATREPTAGQAPVFEICAWGEAQVADWAYRYSNVWRTSADITPSSKSMLHNFDTAAQRTLFAGPGHWNDPDLLEVGNGGFDSRHPTEARTQMSLWAIMLPLSFSATTSPRLNRLSQTS